MSDQVFAFVLDTPYEEEIQFVTLISESEGGAEQRYQKWQKPKRVFRLKLDARYQTEADQIWRFYTARKGSFDSFLFQNPSQNPVTAEQFGSGDGLTSNFYLGSSVDMATGDLIVTPGSAVVKRSIGGTGDFLAFSAYAINESIGKITPNSLLPSGDVLKADYNFRFRVRFKDDNMTREIFAVNLYRFGVDLIQVI